LLSTLSGGAGLLLLVLSEPESVEVGGLDGASSVLDDTPSEELESEEDVVGAGVVVVVSEGLATLATAATVGAGDTEVLAESAIVKVMSKAPYPSS
jgi:hypothetical protein